MKAGRRQFSDGGAVGERAKGLILLAPPAAKLALFMLIDARAHAMLDS